MINNAQKLPLCIVPKRFGDARGWFCESFSRQMMVELGVHEEFVQDNHSFSATKGTLRGLHFQLPPHDQAKLVRCLVGSIWDVAVDVRAKSPTYGRWVAAKLTADGGEQFYIPSGFAHGFVTLTDSVEVAYKVTAYYAPEFDGGIAWNDPMLAIDWPLNGADPILSDKDRALPPLSEFSSPFTYDGVPLVSVS